MAQRQTYAEWPSRLLTVGCFTILAAVVTGAVTDGSIVAKYVALVGLLPIAAAVVALGVQRVLQYRDARRFPSGP